MSPSEYEKGSRFCCNWWFGESKQWCESKTYFNIHGLSGTKIEWGAYMIWIAVGLKYYWYWWFATIWKIFPSFRLCNCRENSENVNHPIVFSVSRYELWIMSVQHRKCDILKKIKCRSLNPSQLGMTPSSSMGFGINQNLDPLSTVLAPKVSHEFKIIFISYGLGNQNCAWAVYVSKGTNKKKMRQSVTNARLKWNFLWKSWYVLLHRAYYV